ncbi:MAG TPA: hypothetical protein VNF51_02680 [Candidatus Paceibacterota bacterium]|nr:hypothetical protein [Candidatus Paceibacterota bacterium]
METEKLLPAGELVSQKSTQAVPVLGVPSAKQQSWGAVISIVIIVLMVIIGAFYAWGQRISQSNVPAIPAAAQ